MCCVLKLVAWPNHLIVIPSITQKVLYIKICVLCTSIYACPLRWLIQPSSACVKAWHTLSRLQSASGERSMCTACARQWCMSCMLRQCLATIKTPAYRKQGGTALFFELRAVQPTPGLICDIRTPSNVSCLSVCRFWTLTSALDAPVPLPGGRSRAFCHAPQPSTHFSYFTASSQRQASGPAGQM